MLNIPLMGTGGEIELTVTFGSAPRSFFTSDRLREPPREHRGRGRPRHLAGGVHPREGPRPLRLRLPAPGARRGLEGDGGPGRRVPRVSRPDARDDLVCEEVAQASRSLPCGLPSRALAEVRALTFMTPGWAPESYSSPPYLKGGMDRAPDYPPGE